MHSNANLLTLDCGEGTYGVYCKVSNKGSNKNRQLMLKRPDVPSGFQGRAFKGKLRERVTRYLIKSWTFFSLVDGGETGWYFRSQHSQHLIPTGLGSSYWY